MVLLRGTAQPFELAMRPDDAADCEHLRAHGWRMVDAYGVARDPWVYQDYLARLWDEWNVAKDAYVARRSGWFSCRSACYHRKPRRARLGRVP